MQVKFKRLHESAVFPKAAHIGDALDLSAVGEHILQTNVPALVKTGWAIELPPGFRAWVTPRSGLALKHGLTIWNAPGLIDEQYRGEIGAIVLWSGWNPNTMMRGNVPMLFDGSRLPWVVRDETDCRFRIAPGDRIAQISFQRIEPTEIIEAEELTDTTRGAAGFGSTGVSR